MSNTEYRMKMLVEDMINMQGIVEKMHQKQCLGSELNWHYMSGLGQELTKLARRQKKMEHELHNLLTQIAQLQAMQVELLERIAGVENAEEEKTAKRT